MRTIQVSDRPPSLEKVLKAAQEENVILRLDSGKEYLLAEIDDLAVEVRQIQQNDELLRLLEERSEQKETYSLSEVKDQLGLT